MHAAGQRLNTSLVAARSRPVPAIPTPYTRSQNFLKQKMMEVVGEKHQARCKEAEDNRG
jgi:hypothetical protein